MVRILSSGEIVPDDDPRAQQGPGTSGHSGQGEGLARQRQGYIQHDEDPAQQPNAQGGVSVFDGLNQRLLDAGVPRWNLGSYTVEPIVSAGFLLALLLMGFRGLLFAGLLFFVVKYSQSAGQGRDGGQGGWQGWLGGGAGQGGPGQGNGGRDRSTGNRWGAGSGHRLGR